MLLFHCTAPAGTPELGVAGVAKGTMGTLRPSDLQLPGEVQVCGKEEQGSSGGSNVLPASFLPYAAGIKSFHHRPKAYQVRTEGHFCCFLCPAPGTVTARFWFQNTPRGTSGSSSTWKVKSCVSLQCIYQTPRWTGLASDTQEQKRAFPFPCFLKMSAGQCFCYFWNLPEININTSQRSRASSSTACVYVCSMGFPLPSCQLFFGGDFSDWNNSRLLCHWLCLCQSTSRDAL